MPSLFLFMVIRTNHIITRAEVQANPTTLYLFGDNELRKGFGGQAKEMRGEPNTVGIRTKRYPANTARSFFSDDRLFQQCEMIRYDIYQAIKMYEYTPYTTLVIPPIGTGLADLPKRAPGTYEYLMIMLKALEMTCQVIDEQRKTLVT